MSTVSLNAGDTSWIDSVTCDLCGKKAERKGTGRMERVPLSISDPRVRQHTPTSEDLEIEYEQRVFEPSELAGWGGFGVGRDLLRTEGEHRFDFCPTCAAVLGDYLLEKCGDWGTYAEEKYGKEVPQRGLFTTNLDRVGELGAAIIHSEVAALGAELGYDPPMSPRFLGQTDGYLPPDPIPRLAYPVNAPPGPCIWREGGGSTQICGRPSMAGQWHCFEHAARDR